MSGFHVSESVSDVDRILQSVTLYHQPDVFILLKAGAAEALMIFEYVRNTVLCHYKLYIAVLTVAYDK